MPAPVCGSGVVAPCAAAAATLACAVLRASSRACSAATSASACPIMNSFFACPALLANFGSLSAPNRRMATPTTAAISMGENIVLLLGYQQRVCDCDEFRARRLVPEGCERGFGAFDVLGDQRLRLLEPALPRYSRDDTGDVCRCTIVAGVETFHVGAKFQVARGERQDQGNRDLA